jgi:hypothetical protein
MYRVRRVQLGSDERIGSLRLGRLLGPVSGRVLGANRCHNAHFPHTPERLGSNIGTAGLVAQIFCKQFFVSVRSREARFDRYLRNGESPD